MQESGQNQYRPEQFKLKEYFRVFAPNLEVILEHPIPGIGIADLFDKTNGIVWLLDGGSHIHGGRMKKNKDDRQIEKYMREYQVIIVSSDSYSWNWLWQS
jgi:hypothetical protein